MVQSLTDFEREGAGRDGGRVDYIEYTSIFASFYIFVESCIWTILLFVQSWKNLLPFVESVYWIDETKRNKRCRQIVWKKIAFKNVLIVVKKSYLSSDFEVRVV